MNRLVSLHRAKSRAWPYPRSEDVKNAIKKCLASHKQDLKKQRSEMEPLIDEDKAFF